MYLNRIIALLFTCASLAACRNSVLKEEPSLKKNFDAQSLIGCFAIYDVGQGDIVVYNPKRFGDSSYLPASTFKIFNSLVGLETGRLTDTGMVIAWDGQKRRPEWDQDLTMGQAFRASSVPYYQELARRIGRDTMQFWIDSLGYGSRNISGPIDSFWLNNKLKIKPDEQLGLLKKLYFKQLPFRASIQEKVKAVMLQEKNANYSLSYKTGWGNTEKNNALGWVMGWIEENNHPYFFVLNMESANPEYDMRAVRIELLKNILKQLGFLEGKR